MTLKYKALYYQGDTEILGLILQGQHFNTRPYITGVTLKYEALYNRGDTEIPGLISQE